MTVAFDFEASEHQLSDATIEVTLRDRAKAAWEVEESGRVRELLAVAHDALFDLLGETSTVAAASVQANPDGTGEVELTVDRMRFKVCRDYGAKHNLDVEFACVLFVQVGEMGWAPLSNLAMLGALLAKDRIHLEASDPSRGQ